MKVGDPDIEEFCARVRGMSRENEKLQAQVKMQQEHIIKLSAELHEMKRRINAVAQAALGRDEQAGTAELRAEVRDSGSDV